MRPTLEITHPDGRKETIQLVKERTVVGRGATADIRIRDNRISREHCALELKGDKVYVVDLGGSNGTWIGRTKILPNVREPFPQEETVHIGPARLNHVRGSSQFDPSSDLESQAFVPVIPQRPQEAPSGNGGAAISPPPMPAPARPAGQSAATLEPHERRFSMNAGDRASLQLTATNQSKIV
ncbi:MAG: FHA domain-containing protein, partial [Chloroflexota bacterium]